MTGGGGYVRRDCGSHNDSGWITLPVGTTQDAKRIYRTRELSPGNLSLIADSNAGTQCDPPSNNQTNSRIWWPYKFVRLAILADGPLGVLYPASFLTGRTPNSEELGILGVRVGALAL